jgi:4-amino-4-deoxy-L-arabinose transferase-like glycosyltransferase
MFGTSAVDAQDGRASWWREPELVMILLLGLATLCIRLDAIPLFGEEPRRALIAREMVESGDWLVPGTQRVFLPSRPPFQNWLIAITGALTGSFDVWSARLPSILSTFAIAILLFGYLRQQFGRLASSSAVAAFLTMTLVMEFGRSAETEAVFSLVVAASFLLWHWWWIKQWPAWQMWSIGYFFAALGMLTKGLQAPVYFVGVTWLFLIAVGRWREINTRAHWIGVLVFVAVFGAWQGPFTWYRGLEDTLDIYFEDVAGRFVDRNWLRFVEHLVVFPLELFCVRMMPWSILLLAFANRRVRELLRGQRETMVFLTISILFTFLTVWLPPGAKVRYYMPLFPCFAALVGIAIDRMAILRTENVPNELWNRYVKSMSFVMFSSAVVAVAVSIVAPGWRFSLPLLGSIEFALGGLLLAIIARKSLDQFSERRISIGVFSIAGFLALAQVSLVVTVQQRRCEDIAGQIERLKGQLPADARLVSLGPLHHAFVFFYQQQIPIIATPPDADKAADFDYFCLHTHETELPELPFAWDEVGVISCDRFKGNSTPKERVFVGRRRHDSRIDIVGNPSKMKSTESLSQ